MKEFSFMTDDEKADTLKAYLRMPEYLASIVKYRECISSNFYNLHSIVGGMTGYDIDAYERAIRPETATLEIIGREESTDRKIKRMKRRLKWFNDFLDELSQPELERLITFENGLNEVQEKAINYIAEIEEAMEWEFKVIPDKNTRAVDDVKDLESDLSDLFAEFESMGA